MPGAKGEPSPGQKEQDCLGGIKLLLTVPHLPPQSRQGGLRISHIPRPARGMEEFARLIPHKVKLTLEAKGPWPSRWLSVVEEKK